jgi:ankyrin repeat protein
VSFYRSFSTDQSSKISADAYRTPICIGWEKALIEDNEDFMRLLLRFDDDDHPTTQQFTILHKIILNIIQGDLEEELQRSTATINDVDANGRTALSWAVTQRDYLSTRRLLFKGASPEKAAKDGKLPLHKAALAQSRPCLRILARHTNDINSQDSYGNTALHYIVKKAVQLKTQIDKVKHCIEYLRDRGADLDRQDMTGKTALRYCVDSNNTEAATLLLDSGADIHLHTLHGMAPVHAAIYYNRCEMLRLLIQRGALQMPQSWSGAVYDNATLKASAETKMILMEMLDGGLSNGMGG